MWGFRPFLEDEAGSTAIEYALIAGLIFLGIVASISGYADATGEMYDRFGAAIGEVTGDGGGGGDEGE